MDSPTNKMVRICILAVLGVVLNLIEPPVPAPIPGIKLGLANLMSIIGLYSLGTYSAIWITIIRTITVNLFLGFDLRGILSLGGGVVSALVMEAVYYFYKRETGVVAVSMLGGLMHNFTQWLMVVILLQQPYLVVYLPFLLLSGGVAGLFVGTTGVYTLRKLGGFISGKDSQP